MISHSNFTYELRNGRTQVFVGQEHLGSLGINAIRSKTKCYDRDENAGWHFKEGIVYYITRADEEIKETAVVF